MKQKQTKPNCYECKWRGEIPGDCHSCCRHPATGITSSNVFDSISQMLSGQSREGAKKLNIRGHEQGIRSGWFMWPANFDPVWLVNCDGFESKVKQPEEAKP